MTSQLELRDFVYLDIERVRAFVAQASGGLPGELVEKDEERTAGKGQIEGGIPQVFKATGGVDYHYARTQSETKSLHDHIFHEFFSEVLEAGPLTDLSKLDEQEWSEDLFPDGRFMLVSGPLKILDYRATVQTIESLPKIENSVARLSAMGRSNQVGGNKPAPQKSQGALAQLPIKDLTSIMEQFYGDTVRVKIFPFPDTPSKVLVGTADRTMFRYSPALLANTYGVVVDAGWMNVVQVNKGVSYQAGTLKSVTGNNVEDALEQMVDMLVNLNVVAQGVAFPAVAITPLAIFRAV